MYRDRRTPARTDSHPGEVHEHDLGLAHDLQVMSRRTALRGMLGLAGVGAAGLAGCAASGSTTAGSQAAAAGATAVDATAVDAATCVAAAPGETAGPYPGDGSNGPNILVESGVLRSDITTSFGAYSGRAEGVPMTLTMDLRDLTKDCAAGEGMAVYVWHADRDGKYSLYSDGVTEQNYLRGVRVAASGRVSFTSVFPACYDGRWPHIHFEVYESIAEAVAGSNARLTSQIALPQDACTAVYAHDTGYSRSVTNLSRVSLATDNVFSDGWDAETPTVTGTPATGMAVAITIGVAAASENRQSAGAAPAGGPGGAPPAGGPGGTPPAGGPGSGSAS